VLTELTSEISETVSKINQFCAVWRSGEPGAMFHVDFEARSQILILYSNARVSAWQRDILPLVTSTIHRSEAILGPENPAIVAANRDYPHSQVNYFSMTAMAEHLQRIHSSLALR
jgi:hypothetical protein